MLEMVVLMAQMEKPPSRLPWPKLRVLRAGFGGMIALLVVSAFEAYRVQQNSSQQMQDIYHRYSRQQDTLYRLRRILYMGGIHARDLFLSNRPDPVHVYRQELAALQQEAAEVLAGLEGLPGERREAMDLGKRAEEYLQILVALADWPEERRRAQGYDFIQRELVPRRNTAGEMARNWISLSQSALMESEREFASSRNAAGTRLLVILGICAVVGVAVARFSLKYTENLEAEGVRHLQEVERARSELQQLSARLLQIQEAERKRLSRELHDEIGQTLTALRIEISHAQTLLKDAPAGARERLERARELAERSVRTVRDISLLLRPSLLDDLGLSPALQSLAEDFTERTGAACDFTEAGLRDTLPDEVKTCVYRVVQEALNNIQKHAAAQKVRIDVRQTDESLSVRVWDDGRGFDASSPRQEAGGRLGILGMRERASSLGGTLAFEPAPGGGTLLSLHLPLAAPVLSEPYFQEAQV
jgi:signal transduction histidine kinase